MASGVGMVEFFNSLVWLRKTCVLDKSCPYPTTSGSLSEWTRMQGIHTFGVATSSGIGCNPRISMGRLPKNLAQGPWLHDQENTQEIIDPPSFVASRNTRLCKTPRIAQLIRTCIMTANNTGTVHAGPKAVLLKLCAQLYILVCLLPPVFLQVTLKQQLCFFKNVPTDLCNVNDTWTTTVTHTHTHTHTHLSCSVHGRMALQIWKRPANLKRLKTDQVLTSSNATR